MGRLVGKSLLWSIVMTLSMHLAWCSKKEDSSSLDPDDIFTEYKTKYTEPDGDDDKVTHQATFFKGGNVRDTYIDLDGDSNITVNDSILARVSLAELNRVWYIGTSIGLLSEELDDPYTYAYTNNKGTLYENVVNIPKKIAFQAGSPTETIDKQAEYKVYWETV